MFASVTTSEGPHRFTGIRPGVYDLVAESAGFLKATIRGIKVDPGLETAVPQVTLELAGVRQSVEAGADVQTVQISNAEIAASVTNEQVRQLPALDRQVLSLLSTQAGVNSGRGPTVVSGLRTSLANVTLDGINIQDNLFRDNSLDSSPNRLTIDQAGEITAAASNAAPTVGGGGAAEVSLITPSGTNQFHGSAFFYNRNSRTAADDWFNNTDGIEKPFLNQNQFGGSIGGPVRRDKLFFFFNYETLRLRQQSLANRTLLTDEARRGVFSWLDSSGAVRKAGIFQLTGARPGGAESHRPASAGERFEDPRVRAEVFGARRAEDDGGALRRRGFQHRAERFPYTSFSTGDVAGEKRLFHQDAGVP